jgi:hypothetical protein
MFDPTLINYSEFNTLTACERKFVYAYVLGQEEEGPKRGLHLGTLIHLWHSRWMTGQGATLPSEWTDDINTGGKPGEVRTLRLVDFEIELVERALWLAGRFVEHYGSAPPSHWNVISAEEWLSRDLGGYTLVGRTDGFVEIYDHLYLVEVKSYGSRPGPLQWAPVSPQLGCYSLLAEEKFGHRPWGVLYQGVYTKQWQPKVPSQQSLIDDAVADDLVIDGNLFSTYKKADQRAWAKSRQADPNAWIIRPAAESFEQLEVELGDAHLRTAELYLQSATWRREVITGDMDPLAAALPSVGSQCRYCGFRNQCWNDLGGIEPFEIELEDEDAEPV